MTSPYVTFAQQPPARGSAWPVIRALLSVLALAAGVLGFVVAGFFALVTWTGCFIGCTGENHPAGAALGLLAVSLLAAGPAIVAGLYRSHVWWWICGLAAAAGSVLLTLVVGAN